MRINKELMGKTAGEVMISRLKNKQHGIQVLKVNQILIDRGSERNLDSNSGCPLTYIMNI
ncbi:MAG: hypothetical protein KAJ15_13380 [Spirochaetes bacterium]|nr:hypothetical protein [Spirochaetota bacterium]